MATKQKKYSKTNASQKEKIFDDLIKLKNIIKNKEVSSISQFPSSLRYRRHKVLKAFKIICKKGDFYKWGGKTITKDLAEKIRVTSTRNNTKLINNHQGKKVENNNNDIIPEMPEISNISENTKYLANSIEMMQMDLMHIKSAIFDIGSVMRSKNYRENS